MEPISARRYLTRGGARAIAALFVIAIMAACAHAQELTVSAAASLADAFKEIGPAFEATKPGTKVVFNFGASGQLLQQIAQGAPVDVFASADQETMDRAVGRSLIAADSRAIFATNVLVLVSPIAAPRAPKSLADLSTSAYRRVALGNPASVPAGRYAREAADAAGLTALVEDKLVFADSVRQVLAYVARSEVDAGFVYRTDALREQERVRIALEVPTRTPITYPVALVSTSRQPALARAFISFLRTPAARRVLDRFGFGAS